MANQELVSLSSSAGLTTLATVMLGPILGEYAVILGLGTLGTLIALSETAQPTVGKSLLFIFKGITLSFVFTSVLTLFLTKYFIPESMGLTPYALLGVVAFCIGWSTDRIALLKDSFLSRITGLTIKSKGEASDSTGEKQ